MLSRNMSKTSQRKGREAEIELSRLLNENGIPAVPGKALNYGTEPDLTGIDGIHAEVKRQERIDIGSWMHQAERDSERFGGWPCVFHRRNREQWHVTMHLTTWIALYMAWKEVKEK